MCNWHYAYLHYALASWPATYFRQWNKYLDLFDFSNAQVSRLIDFRSESEIAFYVCAQEAKNYLKLQTVILPLLSDLSHVTPHVSHVDCGVIPGSNATAGGCVYHGSHCDLYWI